MLIKTGELNEFTWTPGQIPFGVVPTTDGRDAYGMLPQQLGKAALDQLRENVRARSAQSINRDE